jgi:hypothetical protein
LFISQSLRRVSARPGIHFNDSSCLVSDTEIRAAMKLPPPVAVSVFVPASPEPLSPRSLASSVLSSAISLQPIDNIRAVTIDSPLFVGSTSNVGLSSHLHPSLDSILAPETPPHMMPVKLTFPSSTTQPPVMPHTRHTRRALVFSSLAARGNSGGLPPSIYFRISGKTSLPGYYNQQQQPVPTVKFASHAEWLEAQERKIHPWPKDIDDIELQRISELQIVYSREHNPKWIEEQEWLKSLH